MTLGAGFFGMLAMFSAFGCVAGTILLALDGRWIAATIVCILGAALTFFFMKVELNHDKALREGFGDKTN